MSRSENAMTRANYTPDATGRCMNCWRPEGDHSWTGDGAPRMCIGAVHMTACLKCGHDPAARITASWTFEIGREVESMNAHRVNVRGWRGAVYKRGRDLWTGDMLTIRRVHGIPIADRKRRVTLTRMYSGRQRELDVDNLIGGLKSAVDAMVIAGLLIGDRPKDAEIHYAQERFNAGQWAAKPGLRVLLEEIS